MRLEDAKQRVKIGSVYLRDIDFHDKSAEFGIFIGNEQSRGKGFGSEAASLILKYGFGSLKLHRIFLRVFEENIRAINSYKKADFVVEGIARDMVYADDKYRNVVFMSVIENEVL